jgi:hypothetical protein
MKVLYLNVLSKHLTCNTLGVCPWTDEHNRTVFPSPTASVPICHYFFSFILHSGRRKTQAPW